jgi:mRNA interferase YafQ
MREIIKTPHFKEDLKKLACSGRHDERELQDVIDMLAAGVRLPEKYLDHALAGECEDFRECHIRFDRLLLYRLEPGRLVLVRFASHEELYKK